jgi:hypothetical protein
MTLAEAVEVLNRFQHRGHAKWHASPNRFVRGDDYYEAFELFEAVAIAEKYLREQP